MLTLSDYMILLLKPVPRQISSLKLKLDKLSKIDINIHQIMSKIQEKNTAEGR